jgi:uroporphyrinogen decarboxylase
LWGIEVQVANQWEFRREADGAWWWDERSLCPAGAFFFDPPAPAAEENYFVPQDFPSPQDFQPLHEIPEAQLRRLEEDAKWLYENTDLAIFCGETIQDLQYHPGGLQSWWMQMVAEPEACHDFLGRAVEAGLAQLRQLEQAVGKYCDVLLIADDMGNTRGVTVGPDLWRKIYKPHYKRLFTEWHKITRMKVSLHSCGAISEILGDLIECGVDIYNPVQISANEMNPKVLKEKFGDKIIFYGGVYDAVLLDRESSDEAVYEAVKANIRTFSRGGGYLFAGVHNLPPDTTEGHLRAILRAYQDCCREPELLGG